MANGTESQFGALLRKYRKDNRLSQSKLVDRLRTQGYEHYKKSSISKWENSRTKPTSDVVETLEDILAVSHGLLLTAAGYHAEAELRRQVTGEESDIASRRSGFLRDRHNEELLTLANEIRRYLTVPAPFEATAWYSQIGVQVADWHLPGLPCLPIEGLSLSEEQQESVPYLKTHLDDPRFWEDLETVDKEATRYCCDLHGWIEIMTGDAYDATDLPLLRPVHEGIAGFTNEFFDTAMSLAAVMDKEDPKGALQWPIGVYHPGAKLGDLTTLTYGHKTFTVIGRMTEDKHAKAIDVHRMIAFRMSGELIRGLMESHASVEIALEELRSRLMPAAIRLKVVRGHCSLCP